jgi:hypothetical protein
MPTTLTRKHLSRDERIEILSLRNDGNSYIRIARKAGSTGRQVQYVCSINKATPRKGRGRHQKRLEDRITGVIDWIRATFDNRCKSVHQIVAELDLPVGCETLRKALMTGGMTLHLAAQKSPLDSEYPGRV